MISAIGFMSAGILCFYFFKKYPSEKDDLYYDKWKLLLGGLTFFVIAIMLVFDIVKKII